MCITFKVSGLWLVLDVHNYSRLVYSKLEISGRQVKTIALGLHSPITKTLTQVYACLYRNITRKLN